MTYTREIKLNTPYYVLCSDVRRTKKSSDCMHLKESLMVNSSHRNMSIVLV